MLLNLSNHQTNLINTAGITLLVDHEILFNGYNKPIMDQKDNLYQNNRERFIEKQILLFVDE